MKQNIHPGVVAVVVTLVVVGVIAVGWKVVGGEAKDHTPHKMSDFSNKATMAPPPNAPGATRQ